MISGYETFRHIFTVHAQKWLFRSFRSKIWSRHLLRRPRFPITRLNFHYPITFAAYISCFWCRIFVWFCDLDLQPFDLDEVWISFACPVHIPIFSILQLSVSELCVTQSDHITFTWNGHCACAVSRDLSPGAKMIHIFGISEPNLPIDFVTFRALRRRLSHVIGEKSRFPIVKATKFSTHAQYRVTCAQGVP